MKGLFIRKKCWWYRGRVGKEVVQVSLKTRDEAEAIRAARELLAGSLQQLREIREGLIDSLDAWKEHLKEQGLAKRWVGQQHATLLKVALAKEWKSVSAITATAAREWMLSQKSKRTGVQYLEMLHRFLRWCVETRRLSKNPLDNMKRPKLSESIRRHFLSHEEAAKLISTPCEDGLKFAIYCSLYAGLRKGEIIAARPSWFDLKAGLLHIVSDSLWKPKDGDNRTIPLRKDFIKFLESYGLRKPFMFRPEIADNEKGIYRSDFKRSFATHIKNCGVKCTFHDLRRTFASLLVSDGVSIYKVARWLGDGVGVVEKHYGHLISQDGDIERGMRCSIESGE